MKSETTLILAVATFLLAVATALIMLGDAIGGIARPTLFSLAGMTVVFAVAIAWAHLPRIKVSIEWPQKSADD